MAEKIPFRLPIEMYGESACCLVVRHVESQHVCHIIFFVYHGMWSFKNKDPCGWPAVLQDLVWNAACEFSNVRVAREQLFSGKGRTQPMNRLDLARSYRRAEKSSNTLMPHEEARQILRLSAQHAKLVESLDALADTDSVFAAYLRFTAANAAATRRTAEWQASEAAQRMMAGGSATRQTAEWQASEAASAKGLAWNVPARSNGLPNGKPVRQDSAQRLARRVGLRRDRLKNIKPATPHGTERQKPSRRGRQPNGKPVRQHSARRLAWNAACRLEFRNPSRDGPLL